MAFSIGLASLLVALGSMAAYIFVRQIKLWYVMSHFKRGVPGTAYPLIGHTYMFDRDPRAFFQRMKRWSVQLAFENIERKSRVTWMGPVPVITPSNIKDIETILSSSKQLEKGTFYRMLMPWLGDGLLLSAGDVKRGSHYSDIGSDCSKIFMSFRWKTSVCVRTGKGQKWQKRRKLLTPSFHFSILNSFIDIFNEQAHVLTDKLCTLNRQNTVDIFPLITCCTLDVICATAMGKNVGAQNGSNNEYVQAILEMSDLIQERQKYPWLWIDAIYRLLPNGRKHSRNLEILHKMTKSVINERLGERQQMNGSKESSILINNGFPVKRKKMAFLDLLLELHDEDSNFTIDDIREEVDTFMFEGHDTTAAAISWALFMLGHHPQVQERVHKELDDVFGNDRDRFITNEDIQKLQYLGCVIKETLRLYPSVPLISRQLEEDAILSGHHVPKGTLIIIGIYFLHRSAEFFPEPDLFNPDNFLPDNVEGRNPFVYIPFSAGPRNCIGQKFALMEEKVILAALLRKLKFRSVQSIEDVIPIGNLILRPSDGVSDGIMMEVTLRP